MSTHTAASRKDRAAFKAGERALGEAGEKLQEMVERSSEWTETFMLAAGFFLLSVAANAPKELEVLGIKIDVEGNHSKLFLLLLAIALVFRVVQSWALASLSKDAINARFDEVVDALVRLRDSLRDRMIHHDRVVHGALDVFVEEARLPYLAGLFDVSELLEGMDEQGNLKVFSVLPESMRAEAEKLMRRRRQELLSQGRSAWYPEHLWASVAAKAVDLAVAERESFAAGEGSGSKAAALHVDQLRLERDAALAALAQHIEQVRQNASDGVSKEGARLEELVARLDKLNRTALRYRRLATLSHHLHLWVPTVAALASLTAIVAHRFGYVG